MEHPDLTAGRTMISDAKSASRESRRDGGFQVSNTAGETLTPTASATLDLKISLI
jgi:hypothetical protein